MKLYYSPGACSLSPHIVLREAGLKFELEKVDNKTKRTESGADYLKLNAKGYVPLLQLDDGRFLSEGPVVAQYIADLKPESGLAPPNGTYERYKVQEWLNFITSELHKQFSPLFRPDVADEVKKNSRANIAKRLEWLAKELDGRSFLTGEQFTIADSYLFVVLNWARFTDVDLTPWPVIGKFLERVAARPKVQEALKAEGLVK
ncbi:MAG TPA: glutathione transferase GstA [Steroidobacteraceae bacterium]|nr:glutathione transferase GstA [Steroidobacteraceae bacterium]